MSLQKFFNFFKSFKSMIYPIFIPQGKKITFSEMKPSQKFKIDHRYKAFKRIKKFF